MSKRDTFSFSSNALLMERKYFHTSVLWKIASIRERVNRTGDSIVSPLFECSDASWQLTLYPLGENAESEEFTADLCLDSVSLGNESSERMFSAYLKIITTSAPKPHFHSYVREKCMFLSGTSHKFVFPADSYDHEGCYCYVMSLTIFFNICVEESVFPLHLLGDPTKASEDEKTKPLCLGCSSSSLPTDFEKLYDNPQFSDVTLKIGDVEFQAHKLVLSARSEVFAAMFEHGRKENRLDVVELLQMEVQTVQDMLRHIYCGKVRELSPEEALNLYVASDRYKLEELKAFCREIILNELSINNVCDVAAVADLYNDEILINAFKPFLSKNGKEVIKTEKWKAYFIKESALCAKMFEWAFS